MNFLCLKIGLLAWSILSILVRSVKIKQLRVKKEKMKKNFLHSSTGSVQSNSQGQGYSRITAYFLPELITAVILYSFPLLIDARFIACLRSTSSYATLGITNTMLHFITKVAEGLSIGTIVLTGKFNGAKEYKEAGDVLVNAFWTTILVGLTITALLFFGAASIYQWYGVPDQMVALGVPFLRLRAIGVFFTFIYFAFIGFLRGIKNTRIPMYIFTSGCIVFLFFDYVLIFGKCGFPALQLQGSAWATIIQYAFMCVAVMAYIFCTSEMKQYSVNLFSRVATWGKVKQLFKLSWPVMIDKGTLALSYLWLGKCIAPMGTCIIASFTAIKDLERFGLLPAIALAQVVTFLVSNDCGRRDWVGIKITIKRVMLLSCIMSLTILFFCCLSPARVIRIFDMRGEFTDLAATLFPIMSALAIFDIIQLILAGALRGASNVKTVMWARLIICGGVFFPLSYFFSQMPMTNQVLKFMLIYSSLYFCNALMGIIYLRRFREQGWIKQAMRTDR